MNERKNKLMVNLGASGGSGGGGSSTGGSFHCYLINISQTGSFPPYTHLIYHTNNDNILTSSDLKNDMYEKGYYGKDRCYPMVVAPYTLSDGRLAIYYGFGLFENKSSSNFVYYYAYYNVTSVDATTPKIVYAGYIQNSSTVSENIITITKIY